MPIMILYAFYFLPRPHPFKSQLTDYNYQVKCFVHLEVPPSAPFFTLHASIFGMTVYQRPISNRICLWLHSVSSYHRLLDGVDGICMNSPFPNPFRLLLDRYRTIKGILLISSLITGFLKTDVTFMLLDAGLFL